MIRNFTFFLCFVKGLSLYAQGEGDSLCSIHPSHPVTFKARQLIDSLQRQNTDTILFYLRFADNTDYGYGKVLWQRNGATRQYNINYDYEKNIISSIRYQKVKSNSIFHFYFQNRLDTLSSNPRDEDLESMSHDGHHFVWVSAKQQIHCFEIRRAIVYCYPENLRSQLVRLLIKPAELEEMKKARKQLQKKGTH